MARSPTRPSSSPIARARPDGAWSAPRSRPLPQHPVLDRDGELIGAVVEWLLERETNRILYAVLLYRDRHQHRAKLLPLPFSQFEPLSEGREGRIWQLPVSRRILDHLASASTAVFR